MGSFFPPPESADEDGLVAITDHLTPELLADAYRHGIFPWSAEPVRWYSPDPRTVFIREHIRLPRNLRKIARKSRFSVTFDTSFREVISACSDSHTEYGTWICGEFIDAYTELHSRGLAHSVEVWQKGALVGGLYGVQTGAAFSGESMFHRVSNASKIAFAALIAQLDEIDVHLFDAQVINQHTHQLGALLVHRHDYLKALAAAQEMPTPFAESLWPNNPTMCLESLLTFPPRQA